MATDIRIRLGSRIRELRKAKGWRQLDLAEHSGVHEVHVSDLERGAREAGVLTLQKLADALDLSLAELFQGL